MMEYLAMGGYAKYVWPAFGVSFFVLLTTVVLVKRGFAATRQRVLRQIESVERIQS